MREGGIEGVDEGSADVEAISWVASPDYSYLAGGPTTQGPPCRSAPSPPGASQSLHCLISLPGQSVTSLLPKPSHSQHQHSGPRVTESGLARRLTGPGPPTPPPHSPVLGPGVWPGARLAGQVTSCPSPWPQLARVARVLGPVLSWPSSDGRATADCCWALAGESR